MDRDKDRTGSTPTRSIAKRSHISLITAAAVLAAGGTGAGIALAARTSPPGAPTATAAPTGPASGAGYAYYRSVMANYAGGGSMMGGMGGGSMISAAGYRWMMGGSAAPGWMRDGTLPGSMMGSSGDPSKVMGKLWADASGQRVSPAAAARLGSQAPAGARVDRAKRTITFTSSHVQLTALASPAMPGEFFRIVGLVNPALVVPAGARVSIELINADDDMAHGLVVTTGRAASWMPMMTAGPAFSGAALWFLGDPTPAGMHAGTLTFTASRPGSYRYLCPLPDHAQEGMAGTLMVTSSR